MPSPNLPPITDITDPAFLGQACLALDKYNATAQGVPVGALPLADAAGKWTAEAANATLAAVRSFVEYVRGLGMPTQWRVAEFFGLPVFTTVARPAASASHAGRVIFNSTTNRIQVDIGGAWVQYLAAGDVESTVPVDYIGGGSEIDGLTLLFDENYFALASNNDDAEVSLVARAARSVFGRSANSSGVPADIQGAGNGSVLSDNGTSLAFRSLSLLTFQNLVFYEVDFAALASNAFADGNEVIDGLTWVAANSASVGATWGLDGSTGLVHTATTFSTTFTSTTQTAALIYLPLASIPNWVPGYSLFVDVHIPSSTYEQNTDRCVFGLWSPSGTPEAGSGNVVRGGFKGNDGGDITNGVLQQATATAAADAHNVTAFSARIDPMGDVLCGHGSWSAGWPANNAWTYNVGANASITAGPNGLNAPTARIVLAFPQAADASPTTTTTIANLRVRRG